MRPTEILLQSRGGAGWAVGSGSSSDAHIFNCSKLKTPEPLVPGGTNLHYFLLGEDAFALMPWLVKLYSKRQLTREETIANYRISMGKEGGRELIWYTCQEIQGALDHHKKTEGRTCCHISVLFSTTQIIQELCLAKCRLPKVTPSFQQFNSNSISPKIFPVRNTNPSHTQLKKVNYIIQIQTQVLT